MPSGRSGNFENTTFVGKPVADVTDLRGLPAYLREVLLAVNGFVCFDGAFHLRGLCDEPTWHSLQAAWAGEAAMHRLFPRVRPTDIPFAEDALGNQFLIRDDTVYLLKGETGEIESLELPPDEFMEALADNPTRYVPIDLVQQFKSSSRGLAPGELLSAYPPLCTLESAQGVSLKAIPWRERLLFLSDFAGQISDVRDGARIRITVRTGEP